MKKHHGIRHALAGLLAVMTVSGCLPLTVVSADPGLPGGSVILTRGGGTASESGTVYYASDLLSSTGVTEQFGEGDRLEGISPECASPFETRLVTVFINGTLACEKADYFILPSDAYLQDIEERMIDGFNTYEYVIKLTTGTEKELQICQFYSIGDTIVYQTTGLSILDDLQPGQALAPSQVGQHTEHVLITDIQYDPEKKQYCFMSGDDAIIRISSDELETAPDGFYVTSGVGDQYNWFTFGLEPRFTYMIDMVAKGIARVLHPHDRICFDESGTSYTLLDSVEIQYRKEGSVYPLTTLYHNENADASLHVFEAQNDYVIVDFSLSTENLPGGTGTITLEQLTPEADAKQCITLQRHDNKAVISGSKKKVYVGFTANIPDDYTLQDYGLIYYNSGTVITTPYLTLENVGICGIQKAKYWSANITDNGYGVTAVGFVTVKDANGCVVTLYTEELGSSFAEISQAAAEKAVTFTRQQNKALISGSKKKVYVGFSANIADDYTLQDYGLIYYNSGTVITTPYLTLENVGICGIQKAKYWTANITDNGYGVTAVGFVTVKDANGYETTLYTEELGNSYQAMTDAANAVTLTRLDNKAVTSGGKHKVYVGFSANVPAGYTVEDYGLIYYNSGTVITTPYLTLENVGICGIQKAKYWAANITDNGYGVTAVGFVTVKDANGYVTTLYTGELGAKYSDLVS